MADFSLVPVPKVSLVHAVIFIANTIVVKKLMIDPYLKLKAKRLDYTERKRVHAEQRTRELNTQLAELRARRQAKLAELEEMRRTRTAEARAKREEIIKDARQRAEGIIRQAREDIERQFREAHTEIDEVAGELSTEMMAKLLPR